MLAPSRAAERFASLIGESQAKEAQMQAAAPHWRELARRAGDGVEIALLASTSANRVKIAVTDGRLCHHVDLDLETGDGLQTFLGPFADAARRTTDDFGGAPASLLRNNGGLDEGMTA